MTSDVNTVQRPTMACAARQQATLQRRTFLAPTAILRGQYIAATIVVYPIVY